MGQGIDSLVPILNMQQIKNDVILFDKLNLVVYHNNILYLERKFLRNFQDIHKEKQGGLYIWQQTDPVAGRKM